MLWNPFHWQLCGQFGSLFMNGLEDSFVGSLAVSLRGFDGSIVGRLAVGFIGDYPSK
jgi:hypothetical protein